MSWVAAQNAVKTAQMAMRVTLAWGSLHDRFTRPMKIPNWAMDVLRKRRQTATSEWVFPSSSGTLRDPDNTRKALRGVLEGSEWEGLHPHAFRHLVATQLDAVGLTAREIADYLGHAQVSMTQDVYMNRKSVGHRAADALEGLKPTE